MRRKNISRNGLIACIGHRAKKIAAGFVEMCLIDEAVVSAMPARLVRWVSTQTTARHRILPCLRLLRTSLP